MTSEAEMSKLIEHWGGRVIQQDGDLIVSLTNATVTDERMKVFSSVTYESLTWISLAFCKIGDRGVGNLSRAKTLKILDLTETEICGEFLKDFQAPLQVLKMQGCRNLKGCALRNLSACPNLRELWIGDTDVDDTCLSVIGELKLLEKLYLQNTKITDRGIAELSGLEELRHLNIDGTGATRSGFTRLKGQLPTLVDTPLF